MNKKLIILGNGYEWCDKSLEGLKKREGVFFDNGLPIRGKVLPYLSRLILSDRANKYISNSIKKIIYKKIINNLPLNDCRTEDICLLIYDGNRLGNQIGFFNYLRKKYSGIKIAYIFTNIVKYTEASGRNYVENLNEWYDVVFAFDPDDAQRYGFHHSPLIYDPEHNYNALKTQCNLDKVFYVGQAKDRLNVLLSIYEKLQDLNIESDFNITNVAEDKTKYSDKIVYNKHMKYSDVVLRIQQATCLVDVIQGDSTGLTIKNCEAICYNKKLITTNKQITKYPFYDPRYIRVVESPDDIDEEFFTQNRDVCYSEYGRKYFSADEFWNRLWQLLLK